MSKPYVKQTIVNNISYIEFYHPSQNSLPGDLLQKLEDFIKKAGNHQDVKVIVLQSGGDRTFCAGASFKELVNISDENSGKSFFSGFANVINAMRSCPKLIIGRIQGKTVGGGVGIIAASDYCLATKYAEIKLSELNIGIGPFVIAPAVERKIGTAALAALSLQPKKWKSAQWALQHGLFTEVYPDLDIATETAKAKAAQLASYAPQAVAELNKTLWANTDHWHELLPQNAKISGRLLLLPETQATLQQLKSNG